MTERSYRDATRPDKLRRWHGLLSGYADPGTDAETVYDEIGDALDHVSGWTPGVDQREQQAHAIAAAVRDAINDDTSGCDRWLDLMENATGGNATEDIRALAAWVLEATS
jgi:hypothetical protein